MRRDLSTGAHMPFMGDVCFDPGTAFLMFALATAAGGAVSAVGAIQQGQAAKAAGEYNAAVAERNASATRAQTAADVLAKSREKAQHLGDLRAQFGANGLDFSDSALDVFQDHATQAEYDAKLTQYKGNLRAAGYGEEAILQKMGAKSASTAGYIGAGSAVLGSVSKIAGSMPGSSLTAA